MFVSVDRMFMRHLPCYHCLSQSGVSLQDSGRRADWKIEKPAGLPPCAECEVAAKRLQTGSALSVWRKKKPHIEKLSVIPRIERECSMCGGSSKYSSCSGCSSCVLMIYFPRHRSKVSSSSLFFKSDLHNLNLVLWS